MKFHIWMFRKYAKKIQVLVESDKNNGYFTWRPIYIFDNISILLRTRNVSDKSFRENQNTYFMFNNIFFSKIVLFWDNVEKYSRAVHTRQHGACVLLAAFTLRVYHTYRFSTATMVVRTRPNVMLYVSCLPCYIIGFTPSQVRGLHFSQQSVFPSPTTYAIYVPTLRQPPSPSLW